MSQFFADQIDQLDLAIDQLAVLDRNFDRFALMLIDNVVELVLHEHAKEKLLLAREFQIVKTPKPEWKTALAATGQGFDAKVRYARETAMVSAPMADSIQYLHSFRNSAYHQGRRHEGILHSLAVFYFKTACSVLAAYKPTFYGISSRDKISHRTLKYIGRPSVLSLKDALKEACARLIEVAGALEQNLVEDLQIDMMATIEQTDEWLDFIVTNDPQKPTRGAVVRDCQSWSIALTDEGQKFARASAYKASKMAEYIDWLSQNYPWAVKTDPIEGWKRRHASLRKETDPDAALKKYCDFMKQTDTFRSALGEACMQLEGYIEQQFDESRGR